MTSRLAYVLPAAVVAVLIWLAYRLAGGMPL